MEELSTPYTLDVANKPAFVSVAGNTDDRATVTVSYNGRLTIDWEPARAGSSGVNVTGVTLVAPSSDTHSHNSNLRVIRLPILRSSAGQLTVALPPNANVAPPQSYMMFLLNRKTYSIGRWVRFDGKVVSEEQTASAAGCALTARSCQKNKLRKAAALRHQPQLAARPLHL